MRRVNAEAKKGGRGPALGWPPPFLRRYKVLVYRGKVGDFRRFLKKLEEVCADA